MDHYRQCLRTGAAAILCALILRLGSTGFFQPIAQFLTQPDIASFLIYLETGRIVRFSQSMDSTEVFFIESHIPDFARKEESPATLPSFTDKDGAAVSIRYNCALRPDLKKLITAPLNWDLRSDEPTVLILHTHGTESYTKSPGENYKESSAYRTLDEDYNMISVGAHLAELLEEGGIRVIHDKTTHDYPSYSGSYNHARKSISQYLKEYPSIRLVLDLHRDAVADNSGKQLSYTVPGTDVAKLMLVVGSDAGGLSHSKWPENMSLAVKLHAQLEQLLPGICRPISFRTQRFNQDLSTGALIVEVGAAGNTRQQALKGAEYLAKAIIGLASGTAS